MESVAVMTFGPPHMPLLRAKWCSRQAVTPLPIRIGNMRVQSVVELRPAPPISHSCLSEDTAFEGFRKRLLPHQPKYKLLVSGKL